MKESNLQRKAIAYLRDSGAYVFKVVGSPMQHRGTPDLLVCFQGRFIGIELKVPGKEPNKVQEVELLKIREAGGIAVVITDIANLEQVLTALRYRKERQ